MEELSLKVRAKRGNLGIRAVAKEIGISHTTLARVESGKHPDLKTFGLICKWLDIDPNGLLGLADRPPIDSPVPALPTAHFRASRTMKPETAHRLAELILAVQKAAPDNSLPH